MPLFPLVLALSLFLALPALGYAQIKVVPQVGVYAPVSDLGELRDNTGETLLELGRRESTLALGLDLEWAGDESPLGLRGGVAYATQSTIPIDGMGCVDCSARGSLASAGAALLMRPFPRMALIRPYLLGGGGILYYDFDARELEDENWGDILVDQSKPYLHLGIGTQLFLGIFTPQVELSARISGFDPGQGSQAGNGAPFLTSGDRQTNLFLTVGIPLG